MLAAYRPLLAIREARRPFLASLVGRLAVGMLGVPLVLVVQDATGSFGAAGAAAAAEAVGVALSAPLRGRLVDRAGARRALVPLAAVEALALATLPLVARTGNAVALTAAATVIGLAALPLVAAMRLQWQRVLGPGDPRLERAYALETVAQISVFVVGPAVAGAGIALAGPGAVLEVCALLTLAGGLVFAASVPAGDGRPPAVHRRSPLAVPGMRTLMGVTVLADACLGVIAVAVVAAAERAGDPGAGGLLLAVFSGAAALGGAVFGARTHRRALAARLAAIPAIAAVAFLPLALAGPLPLLAVALAVAGPATAAQWATVSVALDRVAPAGTGAEAATWVASANAAGVALGSALAGWTVERAGTSTAFLTASGFAVLACAVVVARRRTLEPLAA